MKPTFGWKPANSPMVVEVVVRHALHVEEGREAEDVPAVAVTSTSMEKIHLPPEVQYHYFGALGLGQVEPSRRGGAVRASLVRIRVRSWDGHGGESYLWGGPPVRFSKHLRPRRSPCIGIVCYPTFGGSGVVATELGGLAHKGHTIHFITYDRPVRLRIIWATSSTMRSV